MFKFLSVLKTRRRYVNSGRLLADQILQHVGSEHSDPIREIHFLMFFCFFAFSNLRKVHGFWPSLGGTNYPRCRYVTIFLMSDFLSVFKTRRRDAKLSRAESTSIDRPALYTLTPDRPPWRPVLVCKSLVFGPSLQIVHERPFLTKTA